MSTTNSTSEGDRPNESAASTGQILIMFALFLTVMIGAVGLSVDLGFAISQRRSMQNAADAGALAGARIVAKSTSSTPLSAQADVEAIVMENAMELGVVGTVNCVYINDAGGSLGSCAAVVPSGASGVRVTVDEQHPTFFIKILPGAPDFVTTSARAAANVKKLGAPVDGPFLPCATNTELANGGHMDIMIDNGNGTWTLNEAAIGQTFKIHGPQIEDCNVKPSNYKGVADQDRNWGLTAPGWFYYEEGNVSGPIRQDLEGIDGCKAGQEPVNCVVFLPIAVEQDPQLDPSDKRLYVVDFMPFYVTEPTPNTHHGRLLADYVVNGSGQPGDWGWDPNHEGPITIRLTE